MELVRFQLNCLDEDSIKERISNVAATKTEKTKFIFIIQAIVDESFNVTNVVGDCITGETSVKMTNLLHEYYK